VHKCLYARWGESPPCPPMLEDTCLYLLPEIPSSTSLSCLGCLRLWNSDLFLLFPYYIALAVSLDGRVLDATGPLSCPPALPVPSPSKLYSDMILLAMHPIAQFSSSNARTYLWVKIHGMHIRIVSKYLVQRLLIFWL